MTRFTEPLLWSAALLALYLMDASGPALSFCLFKWAGVSWCPGCGIGHAIHHALHLRFAQSISEHWFGIPATAILLHRIFKTFYTSKNHQEWIPTRCL